MLDNIEFLRGLTRDTLSRGVFGQKKRALFFKLFEFLHELIVFEVAYIRLGKYVILVVSFVY